MSKSKKTYPEIDDIREDLDSLRSNVVELTKHVKKDGKQQTKEMAKTISSRLSKLQKKGEEQYHRLENGVKENPGQAVAIAVAAGFLTSMLLKRR